MHIYMNILHNIILKLPSKLQPPKLNQIITKRFSHFSLLWKYPVPTIQIFLLRFFQP